MPREHFSINKNEFTGGYNVNPKSPIGWVITIGVVIMVIFMAIKNCNNARQAGFEHGRLTGQCLNNPYQNEKGVYPKQSWQDGCEDWLADK